MLDYTSGCHFVQSVNITGTKRRITICVKSVSKSVLKNLLKEAKEFMQAPANVDEYTLLDSGNMQKLERVGPYTLIRPAPQAVWRPRLEQSEWQRAEAVYTRSAEGGGNWTWRKPIKREFELLYNSINLTIKLTDFGHLGLFPEQAENWDWLRSKIRRRISQTNGRNQHVLNLFGYTGGSTLAASQAGAHLVHVDAADGVVEWARKNARSSALIDSPIRWLVDDAMKFIKREERRNSKYQGIILDPPSFGRGPKGEIFKIEDDLLPLLDSCRAILAEDALFVLYSCHTPGFTPLVLEHQLELVVGGRGGRVQSGEMIVTEGGGADKQGRLLPSGSYARWSADR